MGGFVIDENVGVAVTGEPRMCTTYLSQIKLLICISYVYDVQIGKRYTVIPKLNIRVQDAYLLEVQKYSSLHPSWTTFATIIAMYTP